MIYLFIGEHKAALVKANNLAMALLKKQPDATLIKVNSENLESSVLDSLVETQGLFFNKNIILCSKVCDDKDLKELISKRIKEIKESPNIFIFIEESLDKKTLEKFEKNSEKVQEVSPAAGKNSDSTKKEEFNIFGLTDALGNRDKKKLWLMYLETIKKSAAEEIYGILWWQIKSMLLAKKSKNAAESGMKPFVFNKAQGFNRNFKEGEIEKIAYDLINVYHGSRRKSSPLEIGLEKWILEI